MDITKKTVHPDVLMEVIAMVHRNAKPGEPVTSAMWNHAYAVVRADHLLNTLIWKHANLTIGEYKR